MPVAKNAGESAFVPAVVVSEPVPAVTSSASYGRAEIVLANGRHVIVDSGIDVVVLARLVAALERS